MLCEHKKLCASETTNRMRVLSRKREGMGTHELVNSHTWAATSSSAPSVPDNTAIVFLVSDHGQAAHKRISVQEV